MLVPQVWFRRGKLRQALRDYPLYAPPHKVEERLLSKEQAGENFDYFMRVRRERLAYFQNWLRQSFGVMLTPDKAGVRALNRWGNKYAGLLLAAGVNGHPNDSYFTYDPAWTGENAGCNVLFDMGIALGEFIIVNCPRVQWALDPQAAVLPRQTQIRKRYSGMSYQRPELMSPDNPVWCISPLHQVSTFAHQMMQYMLIIENRIKFYTKPKMSRVMVTDFLLRFFENTLSNYPKFDPNGLRKEMSREEYINLSDSQE